MHHDTISIAHPPAFQIQWQLHTIRRCGDVDRIYGTAWYWLWTNRMYVDIGACLNLNVTLLDIRCTMIRSQLHTHVLSKYTIMAMAYGSVLMLIEYMERYRVGFGRTGSTLVLVHVGIWMCHYLVYDAPWHHRNYTLACYSTIMAITYDTALWWCWSDISNGIILTLDEQTVRWYWCMFEFECAIAWYTMHHDTIAIAHPPAIQI